MSIFSKSLIMTPHGRKSVDSLSVGDFIYNPLGNPSKITGLVNSSEEPVILTLADYRKIALSRTTLLPVYRRNEKEYGKESVENIMKNPKNFLIRPIKPIELPSVDLPFGPYSLGFFLRSGDIKRSWNANTAIRVRRPSSGFLDLTDEIPLKVAEDSNCDLVRVVETEKKNSRIVYTFNKVDLKGLKWEDFKKFFPEELNPDRTKIKIPLPFMRGSVEQRYSLLSGLIDGRGRTKKNLNSGTSICFDFSSNPSLGFQVAELLASLGINYEYKPSNRKMHIHLTKIQYRDMNLLRPLTRFEENGFGERNPKWGTGFRAHHVHGEKIRSIEPLGKELPMTKILTLDGGICAENYIGIYENL